jgi:hypothetical protein
MRLLRRLIALALIPLFVITFAPNAFADPVQGQSIPRPLFLDFLEYGFSLNSSQIFPNETIKNQVLTAQNTTQYSIPNLEHELMGNVINASDVRINVTPSAIDETKTRLDLEIAAERVNVTGTNNAYYEDVQMQSIYGIHDNKTNLIEMHIPIDVALAYLGRT